MWLRVLGPIAVGDDLPSASPITSKVQAGLAAHLALAGGRPVSTDDLMTRVWDKPTPSSRNALQVAVTKLRQEFGTTWLETSPGGYRIRPESVRVDALVVEQLVQHARDALHQGTPHRAVAAVDEARPFFGGEPLSGLVTLASEQARAALNRLWHDAVVVRTTACLWTGEAAAALPQIRELAAADDLDELAHIWLIRTLAAAGMPNEAISAYHSFRGRLADELGTDPSPVAQAVYASLLDGATVERLIAESGAGQGVIAPEHGTVVVGEPYVTTSLPSPLTSFIGRQAEVDRCVALLAEPGTRLVTVTGPGGTGKTRLAIEVLRALAATTDAPVVFTDLSSVARSEQVMPAVGHTLGLRDTLRPPTLSAVAERIGSQDLVLALDNFEQVIEAGPEVSLLLGMCPNLAVLATSRERLRVQGEHEFPLDPLPIQEPGSPFPGDAVSLFVERAQSLAPSFVLTSQNTPAVVEVCSRVDGLPLAIELAAARIKVLTVHELADRLGQRLVQLTNVATNVPPRHSTLTATIEWSYELLNEAERTLLASLSVFVDGWSLEAAESVCSNSAGAGVVDCLGSLIDKSLVRTTIGAEGARFSFLVTIHEFSQDLLRERTDEPTLRERHADYYLHFAAEVERQLQREMGSSLQRRWESEYGNLVAALSWLLERRDARAFDLICGMWRAWIVRGRTHEGRMLTEQALSLLPEAATRSWAVCSLGLSELYRWQGRLQDAWDLKQAVLPLLRATDPRAAAATLSDLGHVAGRLGRGDEGRALHDEAIQLASTLGDAGLVVHTTLGLADYHLAAGDLSLAAEGYGRVTSEASTLGEAELLISGMTGAAEVERLLGNHDRAKQSYLEVLSRASERDDLPATTDALAGLAALASAELDHSSAVRLVGGVTRLCEQGGYVLSFPNERVRILKNAREESGAEFVKSELAIGCSMPLAELLDLARQEP